MCWCVVWDLAGEARVRRGWVRYTANSDVVLFVIDVSDSNRDRVMMAKKELHQLLEDQNLNNTPLLVILNKMDLGSKFSYNEIVGLLNLDYVDVKRNPWAIVSISALKQTNISDVVDWLLANSK